MTKDSLQLERVAFWCAFGSAVATLFSIAVSQTLLALAVASLLLSGAKLRFPPILWPFGFFVVWTALSMALSDHPGMGRPQLRKFYVWLIALAVMSTFRRLQQARWLVMTWTAVGTLAAILGVYQFYTRYTRMRGAGIDFYQSYIADRITGFMSHWMTFAGLEMILLLFAIALLFWGKPSRAERWLCLAAIPLVGLALVLSLTRGIWLATGAAVIYLLWSKKRWTVALLPLAALVLFVAGPASVKERISSFWKPRGTMDSNQHRIVTWRTGIEMVKAHPWFGVGPEHIKTQFDSYVPADIPRPLPDGWYGHLHNIYLHYAAERGIPAEIAFLWIIIKVLVDWVRALRRLPSGGHPARWLLTGCIAAWIGIMVTGIFELNLGDSEVLLMSLTVMALGYVAVEHAGTTPEIAT